jgi:spoIIIJ-associated protein
MRVVVDAEKLQGGKREKTLEQLGLRLADKVVKTRKSIRLEPMNPYEKKSDFIRPCSHTRR